MPIDLFANSASTTLEANVTTTPTAGSLEEWTVASTGSFPQIGTAGIFQFRAVVNLFTDPNPEIVICEQINSSSQMTVARGAEGSPVKLHNVNDTVTLGLTAGAVQSLIPPGSLQMHAGASAPPGWLICNGQAVSRTTYLALFLAIGTTWGAGDGSTTFNVPDFRGRAPIGVGTGTGLTARTLGQFGGEEKHLLATSELPAHTHSITDPGHSHGTSNDSHSHTGLHSTSVSPGWICTSYSSSTEGTTGSGISTRSTYTVPASMTTGAAASGVHVNSASTGIGANTGSVGSGGAHNVMQPFGVVNFIIRT